MWLLFFTVWHECLLLCVYVIFNCFVIVSVHSFVVISFSLVY